MIATTMFQQLLEAVANYYGSGSDQWVAIAHYGLTAENAESILSQVPGVSIIKNADGSLRSYTYTALESSGSTIASSIDSNVSSALKTTTNIPANMGTVAETGKLSLKSGLSTAGNFVMKEVVPAVAAAGVGITLGKTIDKALYNLNPDFWDSKGMASLNPDTWSSITSGDSSLGASLFNMVYGIDSENKTAQGYIDENALAYIAYYMQTQGVFDVAPDKATSELTTGWEQPIITGAEGQAFLFEQSQYGDCFKECLFNGKIAIRRYDSGPGRDAIFASQYSTLNIGTKNWRTSWGETEPLTWKYPTYYPNAWAHNGKVVYYAYVRGHYVDYKGTNNAYVNTGSSSNEAQTAWTMIYGTISGGSTIPGIGTQPNATTPNISDATSVDDVLQKLKEQYPELWDNSVTQSVVQPDGTTTNYVYVPIGTPVANNDTDTQPTTGNATQSDTSVNPDTSTESLLKTLIDLLLKTPTNTPDTGTGETPAVVIPPGSAGALYKIYNPTNSEINSFGAWLWSSNFIDQLLKLFNEPMQAIIGMHKVFATPAVGGTATIKVGYLDSGVSSNYVSNQYTTIDCGTVSLPEYFNNVFDYNPFTKVHLYLPFIGIVPLDTGDVMRASINVIYHVDVLSGACLAEVRVTRDSAGGVLYTYTGNCAVTYPLSSGSYMGMVASIASIAGGIVGTVASGGSLAPVAMGAVGGIMNAHTNIEHSGSISGNAGAMGCKKPYLIITRPQTNLADNFPTLDGKPANYYTKLFGTSGFAKVESVHVENVPATDAELLEIEMLLKSGVII